MPGTFLSQYSALLTIAFGSAGLCAASLAGALATSGRLGLSPGRRALMHWVPIAVAVIVARCRGYPDIALGILFGTSVAILSTAVGSLCTIAPVGPAPARWKRVWPFTLAAALIVFVAGFNGLLTWKHGVALAVEGLVILSLWRDPTSEHEWAGYIADESHAPMPDEVAAMLAAASALLAFGGAWYAVQGAVGMSHLRAHASPGAIAASLLSLVLATPMIQSGRRLALAGASWIPMTAQIGVVLLNLCLLLPLVALAPYVTAVYEAMHFTHRIAIDWQAISPQVTAFPLAIWRIDTVVLIVLSVLLLPVAVGKWNLGREEGVLLIAGYCAYLLAVTVGGM